MFRGLAIALLTLSLAPGCGSASTDGGTADPGDTPSADAGATSDAGAPGVDPVGTDTTSTDATGTDPEAVTYHGTIRPIITRACSSCHLAGGAGPFPLTYDAEEWTSGAPWWAQTAVASVSSGAMPPWQPDPTCRPMAYERLLTPEEISAFETWQADG
ncbi:MAG: cytochrome c, partial [Myxococcota bacterium]|nr:cytochrome c [Myxococcota bacterium]